MTDEVEWEDINVRAVRMVLVNAGFKGRRPNWYDYGGFNVTRSPWLKEAYVSYASGWETDHSVGGVEAWRRDMYPQYIQALRLAGYVAEVEGACVQVRRRKTASTPRKSAPIRMPQNSAWARIREDTVSSTLFTNPDTMTEDGRYQTRQDSGDVVEVWWDGPENQREEMLDRYEKILRRKKFEIERSGDRLLIRKKPKPKRLSPQERMAAALANTAEPPQPEEGPGKPVHHEVTGELVGWLTKDRFVPKDE